MFRVFGGLYFRHITVNVGLILCNSLELYEVTVANLNDVILQDKTLKCESWINKCCYF
jgi:hypothetical protein